MLVGLDLRTHFSLSYAADGPYTTKTARTHTRSWFSSCGTLPQFLIFPASFPEDIPDGTAIPAWAYVDVTVSCPLASW